MSIASKLTILAFASATAAVSAQNNTNVTPVNNTSFSASTGATGGAGNSGDNSVTVTNYVINPDKPQKVTHDVGSCDGPVFQAIFYKAAYGQTEVKRLELGPRHTGYESRQIPDQNLIEVTPTSVTFKIKSGINYGVRDRSLIAQEIQGTPAETPPVSAKAETAPLDEKSTMTGGSNEPAQVSYTGSNASIPFTYRPLTYLTFTCSN